MDPVTRAGSASARCRDRLEHLLGRSDPSDRNLREFLSGLLAEETRSVDRLAVHSRGGTISRAADRISASLGEEWLDRNTALFLAEAAERDRIREFAGLAADLPAGAVRALLLRETERGRPRLLVIRNVLLVDRKSLLWTRALSPPLRIWFVDALTNLVNQARNGQGHVQDLRSVYDSGVASGSGGDDPFALLLGEMDGPGVATRHSLSAGLDRLAESGTAGETVDVARELLARLLRAAP